MSGPLKIGKAHKAFRGFRPGRPPFIPTVMLCAILLLTLALTLGLLGLGEKKQVQGSPEGESALPAAAALESPSPEEEAEEGQGMEEDDEAEDSDSLSAEASSLTQEEIEAIYFREETSSLQEDTSITEVEASLILESLRDTFPEGKYWNHMGVEDWDELTVTDTPCQHDVYWDTYCNEYTGGIQELFPQFEPMEQCLGFAALLSDLVFGEDPPFPPSPITSSCVWATTSVWNFPNTPWWCSPWKTTGSRWWNATAITSIAASAGTGSSAGRIWTPTATSWSASPAMRTDRGTLFPPCKKTLFPTVY